MHATFQQPSLIRTSFLFITPFIVITLAAMLVLAALDAGSLRSPLVVALPLTLVLMWSTLAFTHWSLVVRSGVLLLLAVGLAITSAVGTSATFAGWIVGTASVVFLTATLVCAEAWTVRHGWLGIVGIWGAWRGVLTIWSGIATWYSATIFAAGGAISTGGAEEPRDNFVFRALVYGWMQWDSGYYRAIAVGGYNTTDVFPRIAFFPLYPALSRTTRIALGVSPWTAAIFVSNVAMLAAVLILYDLVRRDWDRVLAHRSVAMLLAFPTAFFCASGYSESLGLALICGAVWAMRRERWWLAGIVGYFLALCRLPGVAVAVVLAVAILQSNGWRFTTRVWRSIGAVMLPPAGLATFMLYQWWRFGDALAFWRAQRAWDNQLRMPWGTPVEILTTLTTASDWPLRIGQLVVWAVFIVLAVIAVRRMALAYSLTMVLVLVPPYLSNWNESLPRYVLLAFGGFIALAMLGARPWLRALVIGTMLVLGALCTLLFINKFWIS